MVWDLETDSIEGAAVNETEEVRVCSRREKYTNKKIILKLIKNISSNLTFPRPADRAHRRKEVVQSPQRPAREGALPPPRRLLPALLRRLGPLVRPLVGPEREIHNGRQLGVGGRAARTQTGAHRQVDRAALDGDVSPPGNALSLVVLFVYTDLCVPAEGVELPETATVKLSTDAELAVDSTVSLDALTLKPGQAVLLQFPYLG